MPLKKTELIELGEALHARLLKERDEAVVSAITEKFLPLLVTSLSQKFSTLQDHHLIATAAIDALLSYLKTPEKFDPAKARGGLLAYLYMIAYRDLLTLLQRRKIFIEFDAVEGEVASVKQGSDNPERLLLERELLREIESRLSEVDKKILTLMREGVRRTDEYVEILGIQDRSASEQANLVKLNKDRLRKSVQKLIRKLGYFIFPVGFLTLLQRWAKAAARKAMPQMVNLLAIAILIATNVIILHRQRAMVKAANAVESLSAINPPPPQRPAPNGMKGRWVEKIFFASNRGSAANKEQTHIWMMNSDGTQTEQVTSGDMNEANARVSPDGTKLAFQRGISASSPNEIGRQSVWVKDLLTGMEQAVTEATDYPSGIYHSSQPAWSPDGTKIAFTRSLAIESNNFDDQFSKLWVIDVIPDIGVPKQLTSEQGFHRNSPDWSPDGRHILFMRRLRSDAVIAIYSIDVETGKEDEVIPCEGDEYAPRYSPDGSKILWLTFRHTSTNDMMGDVYVTDTLNPKDSQSRLAANSGWGIADWSPDGSRIALTSVHRKLTANSLAAMKASYKGQIPDTIFEELKSVVGREISNTEERDALLKEALGEFAVEKYRYKIPNGFERYDDLWIANADGSHFVQLTSTQWYEDILDWALVFQLDADLAVSIHLPTQQAGPGDKITFTAIITNNGAGTAKGVLVSNELSSEATILSIASTGIGVVSGANNRRTIRFPTLAPNQSETITIVVRINRSTTDSATIANTARVSSTTFDSLTENNSAVATMMVSAR